MSSIRKWRFTTGYGSTSLLTNANTSFWGEWGTDGEPAQLKYTIHAQYELADQTIVDPLERRALFEKRLKALSKYVKRQGILDIDWTEAISRPETLTDVVLDSINPVQMDNNLILEVDLVFVFPTPGTLVRTLGAVKVNPPDAVPLSWSATTIYAIGNTVEQTGVLYRCVAQNGPPYTVVKQPGVTVGWEQYWQKITSANMGDWTALTQYSTGDIVNYAGVIWKAKQPSKGQAPAVNAIWGVNGVNVSGIDNSWFVISTDRPDQTIFKNIARGATIRIPGAQGMATITLTGIRQKVSAADTELARRQASEAKMLGWVNLKGFELAITIDGVSKGQWHLSDVKQNKIDLPDAVTFDLVFFQGYING